MRDSFLRFGPRDDKRPTALAPFAIGLLFSSLAAQAAVEVEPVEPWEINDGYVYYATIAGSPVMAEDYRNFDTTVTENTASEISNGYDNALQFEISGDSLPSGTNLIVVYAELTDDDSDDGAKPIPIATINGNGCDGSSACSKEIVSGYSMATAFSGSKVTIGIYPEDICNAVEAQISTNPAVGCDPDSPGNFLAPVAGDSVTKMELTFAAIVDPGGSDLPAFDELESSVPTFSLTLQFQAGEPQYTCLATPADWENAYFPGDGELYLNTDLFHGSQDSSAPLDKLLVVADRDAIQSGASFEDNEVVDYVNYRDGTKAVKGFKNSEGTTDIEYFLAVEVQDMAGVISNGAAFSCTLSGVQTSEIQGFLQKSRCFIATAAFASMDAPPVSMLRKFRDEFLNHHAWGREFVKWYYAWSPSAAEWLIDHPVFRPLVLRALVPVQVIAWLTLQLTPDENLAMEAEAASTSNQPYIDQIKKELAEEDAELDEDERPSKGSYIDQIKRDLAEEDQDRDEDEPEPGRYIESVKKKLKEEDEDRDEDEKRDIGSYTAREKERLRKEDPRDESRSAIAETKAGRSELKLKRPGAIHHAAGFKVGAAITREIVSGQAEVSFDDIYGTGWVPDLTVYYEFQPFHSEWFGNIGLAFSAGMSHHTAMGTFKNPDMVKPWDGAETFGANSQTRLRFFTMPVSAGLNYRFNLFRILRPYVQASGALIGFAEERTDSHDGYRGFSTGVMMSGGVNILLDWFSRSAAWNQYEANGIKKSYLTLDYSQLSTISGDVEFNVAGFSAGFMFEF